MYKPTFNVWIRYAVVTAVAVCGLAMSLGAILLHAMPIRSFQQGPQRIQLLSRHDQARKARRHAYPFRGHGAPAKRSPAHFPLEAVSDSEDTFVDNNSIRSQSSIDEDEGLFHKPLSASPTSTDLFTDMTPMSTSPLKTPRITLASVTSTKRGKRCIARHVPGASWMRKAEPQGAPARTQVRRSSRQSSMGVA